MSIWKPIKVDQYREGQGFSVPNAHWLSLWAYKIPKEAQFSHHPSFNAKLFTDAKDYELIAEGTYPIPDLTHLYPYCKLNGIPMTEQIQDELLNRGEAQDILGPMIIKYKLREMTNKDNLKHKG